MYALTLDAGGAVVSIAPPGTDERDRALDDCIGAQLRKLGLGPPAPGDGDVVVVGFTARIE
jgi:hypothetical protein